MKDSHGTPVRASRRASQADGPAIQVICLGSGGGPSEENVTGFLARSTAAKWSKDSLLAIDAGSHLAPIIRILSQDFPNVSEPEATPKALNDEDEDDEELRTPPQDLESNGESDSTTILPAGKVFAGLPFPFKSARANAQHIIRHHMATWLITHPHLDHISGFVINTAALIQTVRKKQLAALPSTISALKTHIFNDIIWPNLTDSNNGAGLVSFQSLTEGGNDVLGEGPNSGFIEVCDGLSVKGFRISHGLCASKHSLDSQTVAHITSLGNASVRDGRRPSVPRLESQPGQQPLGPGTPEEPQVPPKCVIDSTAFFIRSEAISHTPTREILIFGDVDPDTVSGSGRNKRVWREAAPKVSQGVLTGIFIECSYADSQAEDRLYGHLTPRHLVQELQVLAQLVKEERIKDREDPRRHRKRKRMSSGFQGSISTSFSNDDNPRSSTRRSSTRDEYTHSASTASFPDHTLESPPLTSRTQTHPMDLSFQPNPSGSTGTLPRIGVDDESTRLPLTGLKVICIHIKDTLEDGKLVNDIILEELHSHEDDLARQGQALGCEFIIAKRGQDYWF